MAEHESYIGICVKNPDRLSQLRKIESETLTPDDSVESLLTHRDDPYVIQFHSFLDGSALEAVIREIRDVLEGECCIAAVNTNYSVEDNLSCFFYLGDRIRSRSYQKSSRMYALFGQVPAADIRQWLQSTRLKLNSKEQAFWGDMEKYIYGYIPEEIPWRQGDAAFFSFGNQKIPCSAEAAQRILQEISDEKLLTFHPAEHLWEIHSEALELDLFPDQPGGRRPETGKDFLFSITSVWNQIYWLDLYFRSQRTDIGFRKLLREHLLPWDVSDQAALDRIPKPEVYTEVLISLFIRQLSLIPGRIRTLSGLYFQEGAYGRSVKQDVFPVPLFQKPALEAEIRCVREYAGAPVTVSLGCRLLGDYSKEPVILPPVQPRDGIRIRYGTSLLRFPKKLNADPVLISGERSLTSHACIQSDSEGFTLIPPQNFQYEAGAFTIRSGTHNPEELGHLVRLMELIQEYPEAGAEEQVLLLNEIYKQEFSCFGTLLSSRERWELITNPDRIAHIAEDLLWSLDAWIDLILPDSELLQTVAAHAKKKKNGGLWKKSCQMCEVSRSDFPGCSFCNMSIAFENISDIEMRARISFVPGIVPHERTERVNIWLENQKLSVFSTAPRLTEAGESGICFDGSLLPYHPDGAEVRQLQELQSVSWQNSLCRIELCGGKDRILSSEGIAVNIRQVRAAMSQIWSAIVHEKGIFSFLSFREVRQRWSESHICPYMTPAAEQEQCSQGLIRLTTGASVVEFARLADWLAHLCNRFSEEAPRKPDGTLVPGEKHLERISSFAIYPGKTLTLSGIPADAHQIDITAYWK